MVLYIVYIKNKSSCLFINCLDKTTMTKHFVVCFFFFHLELFARNKATCKNSLEYDLKGSFSLIVRKEHKIKLERFLFLYIVAYYIWKQPHIYIKDGKLQMPL